MLTTALIVLYVKCFLALWAGLAVHTIVKFNEVNDLYSKGNIEELTMGKFLKMKPWSHGLNLTVIFCWMLIVPDGVKQFPTISIAWFGIKDSVFVANIAHIVGCMFWGYGNSSIALKVFGSGIKYAMNVIDKKTNIADGKPEVKP